MLFLLVFANLMATGAAETVDGPPDSPVDQDPWFELLIQFANVFIGIPVLLSAQTHTRIMWSCVQNSQLAKCSALQRGAESYWVQKMFCHTLSVYTQSLHESRCWFCLAHKKFSAACLQSASSSTDHTWMVDTVNVQGCTETVCKVREILSHPWWQ